MSRRSIHVSSLLLSSLGLAIGAQAQVAFIDGTPDAGHAPEAVTPSPLVEAHPSSLLWPLDRPLGTNTFLSNYVDDAPESGVLRDYMGGSDHLYDGHKGTDIALHNFQVMDRGVSVVAAAEGTVLSTTYHFGDRNTDTPYPDGGNGLSIQHDDGSRSFYWHVRRNSVVVEPGERVEAGQPLAYVGSSGWTPIPHLHFELSDARDPWEGTHNMAPSLWADQPAYVGDAPIWMMDADVFTLSAVGGSLAGLTQRRLKERITAPAVYGMDESHVYVWTHVQANVGDSYTIRVLNAAGGEVGRETVRIDRKTRYGWYAHQMAMPGVAQPGTWRLVFTSGERTLREVPFEVGAETVYAPRFHLPSSASQQMVGGHSFRLTGAVQSLELGVASTGELVTYSLVDAPSYASIDGETLRIAANADQTYRSRLFQVVATDAAARTDTLWIQAVHPQRPPAPLVTSPEEVASSSPFSLTVAPNPVQRQATFTLSVAEPGPVRVTLHTALGRQVATLSDSSRSAGIHAIPLDADALELAAGVYTVRALGPRGVASQRMVVVR